MAVSFYNIKMKTILVVDILGTLRVVQQTTIHELLVIDIRELENGMFFILGQNAKGEVLFKEKIIKGSN
jgi:hypothetical protein